jgi:tetratricopeptide (TPR) repeat protein
VGNVLAEIKNIRKDFIEKTMLNRLYEWLPDDETRTFFRKASVYRMPVNQDFLVAAGGSDERIGFLLHKSLLNRIAGDMYEMHSNTRVFGFEKLQEIDGSTGLKETQVTAANMYIDLIRELLEETIYSTSGYLKSGSLHNLGYIHQQQGRYDEAEELFNKYYQEITSDEQRKKDSN